MEKKYLIYNVDETFQMIFKPSTYNKILQGNRGKIFYPGKHQFNFIALI